MFCAPIDAMEILNGVSSGVHGCYLDLNLIYEEGYASNDPI